MQLIGNMLTMSAVDTQTKDISTVPLNLTSAAKRCILQFESVAYEKNVTLEESVEDGLTTADYVDDRVEEAKIFEDSSSSTNIDESGRTNIVPGEATIVAVADPEHGVPGVTSVVDITVTDKNTGLPINGTVTIDGTTVSIVDGKGTYNYPITVDTSRDGTVLTAVFSSPDYDEVSDDVTVYRDLIPTNTG